MKYICATPHKIKGLKSQAGNMMVLSVFAIVVLSVLGISMSRLMGASSTAILYEVYGLRALNAARSGLDEKVLQVFAGQESDANACTTPLATRYFAVVGMDNCSASTICTVTTVENTNYYRFESTGTCELDAEGIVVSRTLAIDGRDVQ